jgi:hypothetical protein
MGKSNEQKMAMMVDGAQPHCDEPLTAAMICSHSGSMGNLLSSFVLAHGGLTRTSELPNPVLIAVGQNTVYAFKYKPSGFKVKVKKGSEVARWPLADITVESDEPGKVSQFAINVADESLYTLEVTTAMGGREVYEMFLAALRGPGS